MTTLRDFAKALRAACDGELACVRANGRTWGGPTADRVVPHIPGDNPYRAPMTVTTAPCNSTKPI